MKHLAALTIFAFAIYAEIFTLDAFSPEFPLFFAVNDGLSFEGLLNSYRSFGAMWYRPTSFNLFYWIGQQFLDWHNLAGWKLYHFSTVLATCFVIYWFVRVLAPENRLAAFLSAAFFISQPSLFTFVMDVAPFDFIYILLTTASVGFYVRAQRVAPRSSILPSAISWCLFVASLTAKELCLATPGYLLGVSAVSIILKRRKEPVAKLVRQEALRLIPFVAMIPIYWNLQLASMPKEVFGAGGPYRSYLDLAMIGNNLRRFALWIVRIYFFTGETLAAKMPLSTWWTNSAGVLALSAVTLGWIRLAGKERLTLLLMTGWIAAYLIIPVYSGQFFWHINLPMVGYSVLFGVAMSYWWSRVPRAAWRPLLAVALFGGWTLLARDNMHTELHEGTHATAFRINNRTLLQSPPVPSSQLERNAVIYIEDRLNIGPWWYGCYGNLFRFVYKRHDLKDTVAPLFDSVPDDQWAAWRLQPNAFFLRYDENFRWVDSTHEFRSGIVVTPANTIVDASHGRQFAADVRMGHDVSPVWSVEPPLGSISPDGVYSAPVIVRAGESSHVAIEPKALSLGPGQTRRFAAVDLSTAAEVSVIATHPGDPTRRGSVKTRFAGSVIQSGVKWSIEPSGMGTITQDGLYQAPPNIAPSNIAGPSRVTIKASVEGNTAIASQATIELTPRPAIRIRAGGPGLIDTSGLSWDADKSFVGGTIYSVDRPVAGTQDSKLYQSERFNTGPFDYELPVAPGLYRVKLKFAEIYFSSRGQRVFNVWINGQRVLDRFDIVEQAGGPDRAVDREFNVTSTDGWMVIRFEPVVSNPKISAIEVLSAW